MNADLKMDADDCWALVVPAALGRVFFADNTGPLGGTAIAEFVRKNDWPKLVTGHLRGPRINNGTCALRKRAHNAVGA